MKYIIGLSGGLDSCYALIKLCERVDKNNIIAVTWDNGWDMEVAKINREKVLKYTGVSHLVLTTDLKEFHEIQRAFLLSGTPHAECPSDVGIKSALLYAKKVFSSPVIVTGGNKQEGQLTSEVSVVDGLYLADVVKKHGRIKIKHFRNMNLYDHWLYKRSEWRILDEIGWDDREEVFSDAGIEMYDTKHYESFFTKWNQGLRYFKYGIDMRKYEVGADYDLSKPPMPREEWYKMTLKVVGILDISYNEIMSAKSDWKQYRSYRKYVDIVKRIKRIG